MQQLCIPIVGAKNMDQHHSCQAIVNSNTLETTLPRNSFWPTSKIDDVVEHHSKSAL